MQFTRFGIKIAVERDRAQQDFEVAPGDVELLGQQSVDYIRSLDGEEIERRLATVTLGSRTDVSHAREILAEHGIVVIRDYVDAEALAEVDGDVGALYARADEFAASAETFREGSDCLYQSGVAKFNTYRALAENDKPVIQIRSGADKGMVDIFNVDRLAPTFRKQIRPGFEVQSVVDILGPGLKPRNLNAYINQGIQKTRGFHVDTYSPQIKGFLYLTDVLKLEDGPYVYVKGQHKDSVYRRVNRALSQRLAAKTEAPIVPSDDIVPVLAPKGSLVISDQAGFHRGFPQAPHGRRCVAVMNYS